MPAGAVSVVTLKASDRPEVVGFEVGRAPIHLARVLSDPRAGNVVLPLAEWHLVKTTVPQCNDNGIFVGTWNPHRISVGWVLLSLTSPLPLGPTGLRHLQLQAINQFLNRIAQPR